MYRALKHHGPISGIATRGDLVATAGYDNQIVLWNARTRSPLGRAYHDHLVNHCSFSSDGRWLLSSSSDYSARIWSVPSLRLEAVLTGHADDVDMAAFSPDDQLIATCALDRAVRIFDRTGRCLHVMRGHTGNVLSLAWSADGAFVVSSSVDGTVRRWDAKCGVEAQVSDLGVRTDSVEMGASGVIFAGDDRGRLCILTGSETRYVAAHAAGIKKVALDENRRRLVSLSYDRTLVVWQLDDEDGLLQLARTSLPPVIWARAAAILPDGRVATGTFGGTYAIYDVEKDEWDISGARAGPAINAVLVVAGEAYTVGDSGVVSVDGRRVADMGSLCNFLATAGERIYTGGQLGQLYDARTGMVLHEHHSPLNCAAVLSVGSDARLAVGTYTGEILIFSLDANGNPHLMKTIRAYENAVKGLSFQDDALFSVCASAEVAWFGTSDWGPERRVRRAHDRIANACVAIGRGRFASVSRDRSLRLWSVDEAMSPCEVFQSPHPNSIKCVAIDAEERTLMTGSYGGTLATFDLVTKRWSELFRPTASGIASVAWDGLRNRFLAASYDGAIYPVSA